MKAIALHFSASSTRSGLIPRRLASSVVAARALVLAIACMASASTAHGDEALADTLAGSIRASQSLAPHARSVLAQSAADAARPLLALPADVTARLGRDMKAVIEARMWPFQGEGRDQTPEGVEWLQQGVRIMVERLKQMEHPSDADIVLIKAWPKQAAAASVSYTRETLRSRDVEFQQAVIDRVRESMTAQVPLFGNAFVPSLMKPCNQPASNDSSSIERVVGEALRSDAMIAIARQQADAIEAQHTDLDAQILTRPNLTPQLREHALKQVAETREARRRTAIASEAMRQTGVILRALQATSAPCLHASGIDPSPPQWHTDLGHALQEREQERQQALAEAEMRAFEAAANAEAGPDSSTNATSDRPKKGRLTMDEAIELAFADTGIVVIHSTAIPPPSWSRSIRLFARWRVQFPAARSSDGK